MARYNPYNRGMQYPDLQDTPQVPYISYYDPQQVERLGTVIQQRGQRYDAAQAAIAKYLEEAGATEMRQPDRDAVIAKITSDLENVKGKVKERYNGDYGLAVNDVIQGLSKSSGIYKQAAQKYKEEQKYLPLYMKLKSEGKLVTPKGYDPFQQSSFDEETGKFKDIDYSQMYERGDYEGWLAENYSKGFQNEIHETLPNLKNESDPYLIGKTVKGFNDDVIAKKITDKDAAKFLKDNKVFSIEHDLNPNDPNDIETARQYMVKTVQGQVAEQVTYDITANQLWKRNQQAQLAQRASTDVFGPGSLMRAETNPVLKNMTSLTKELGDYSNISDLLKLANTNLQDAIETEKKGETVQTSFGRIPIGNGRIAFEKELERVNALKEGLEIGKNNYIQSLAKEEFSKNFDDLNPDEQSKITDKVKNWTDKDWAKTIDADNKLLEQSVSESHTILNPLTNKMLNTQVRNNLDNASFRISNKKSDLTHIDDIADKIGVKSTELRNYIANRDNSLSYNKSTGEYYLSVPDKFDSKGNPSTKAEMKRVYFNVDGVTQYYQQGLQELTGAAINGEKTPKTFTDNFGIEYTYEPSLNIRKSSKTDPKFTVSIDGKELGKISLQQLQDEFFKFSEKYMFSKYTRPYMTASTQKQTDLED